MLLQYQLLLMQYNIRPSKTRFYLNTACHNIVQSNQLKRGNVFTSVSINTVSKGLERITGTIGCIGRLLSSNSSLARYGRQPWCRTNATKLVWYIVPTNVEANSNVEVRWKSFSK